MSRIRADRIVDRAATGAPLFPNGAVVTGVATATTFDGNATTATSASGLTGTPAITVGNITASSGDLTVRNITGVAATFTGVLTYEDVTNVDAVGIITAQSGAHFNGGALREKINIVSGKLSANLDINLDNGMVHYFTTTEDAQSEPNIKSAAGINTAMAVGDTTSVTIITTAAAAGYGTTIKIDGAETGAVNWVGGSAPSTGGSSGLDIYSYQIIKTADSTFTVIGNLTNAASA